MSQKSDVLAVGDIQKVDETKTSIARKKGNLYAN